MSFEKLFLEFLSEVVVEIVLKKCQKFVLIRLVEAKELKFCKNMHC
jgi:hypothetical protein